jgi:hypothetical protein
VQHMGWLNNCMCMKLSVLHNLGLDSKKSIS